MKPKKPYDPSMGKPVTSIQDLKDAAMAMSMPKKAPAPGKMPAKGKGSMAMKAKKA